MSPSAQHSIQRPATSQDCSPHNNRSTRRNPSTPPHILTSPPLATSTATHQDNQRQRAEEARKPASRTDPARPNPLAPTTMTPPSTTWNGMHHVGQKRPLISEKRLISAPRGPLSKQCQRALDNASEPSRALTAWRLVCRRIYFKNRRAFDVNLRVGIRDVGDCFL